MNATMKLYSSILITTLGLGASLAACGDDTTGTGGTGGTGSSTGSRSSASSTGSASSSSTGGGAELKAINKTPFDAMKGELPEGLAVTPDGATAYVGYAPTGKIVKVALADGTVSDFGAVPAPPAPTPPATATGFALGIALDSAGDVYVGVASFVAPAMYQPGIYKIAKAGGVATLFASDAGITLPNGLVFDSANNLFVTNSVTGIIYKIAPNKTVTKWAEGALLQGDTAVANKCQSGLGFPVGANGILLTATEAIVANTDKATLVKIPINMDGSAGTAVELIKSDATTCLPLKGADGIALDKDGNILVAANSQNALVRAKKDGSGADKLVEAGILDYPASIAFLSAKNEAIVTNAAFTSMVKKPSLASYGPIK